MTDREVYANAPVVLVVLEVRHPATDPLSQAQRSRFKRELVSELPIMKSATAVNIVGTMTPASSAPTVSQEEFPKYFDRPKGISVSLMRESTVIETTRYKHFEAFLDLALRVIQARNEISPIDGIERVGLRYVDELRAPHNDDAPLDWQPWVDTALVGIAPHAAKYGLQVVESQNVALMTTTDSDHRILLRYGPQVGYAVDPAGDLRRPTPTPGSYFLLDIDSFWQPQQETPEMKDVSLAAICNQLHHPVRALFESLITEKMREEVLRNG